MLADHSNDLKGMAWSRDSKYLAVMYHGGLNERGIHLYDCRTGKLIRYLGPSESSGVDYHYLVFSHDNASLLVSADGQTIDHRYPIGTGNQVAKN